MNKIADNFCGYLKIADDMFVYTVSDSIVTLLPAQSDSRNRYDVFHRMRTRNFEQPEFLFGEDSDGMIAMLWNGTYSFSGINTSARFSTPIIIKAAGEYSCAVKPHIRAGGNRQSGIQETVIASLLA